MISQVHPHECEICGARYDCSIEDCSLEYEAGFCMNCEEEYDDSENPGEMDEYYPSDSDEVDPKEF